jgi:hypothetical protein
LRFRAGLSSQGDFGLRIADLGLGNRRAAGVRRLVGEFSVFSFQCSVFGVQFEGGRIVSFQGLPLFRRLHTLETLDHAVALTVSQFRMKYVLDASVAELVLP